MRISDWSSDVCSSDLIRRLFQDWLVRNCGPVAGTDYSTGHFAKQITDRLRPGDQHQRGHSFLLHSYRQPQRPSGPCHDRAVLRATASAASDIKPDKIAVHTRALVYLPLTFSLRNPTRGGPMLNARPDPMKVVHATRVARTQIGRAHV